MQLIVLTEQQIREIAEAAAIAAVVRMREDEPTPPRLMTRAELREYLRCSESTLARRIAEGLPSRGGRLFDKEDVDEWLRRKT